MAIVDNSSVNPNQLRDLLEARRSQLTEELERRRARIREQGSLLAHELDDVDACDLDTSILDLTTTMLRRIDVALERLADGRYGRCTRCRAPIAAARLLAMPFAVRCRVCETAREREAATKRSVVKSGARSDVRSSASEIFSDES